MKLALVLLMSAVGCQQAQPPKVVAIPSPLAALPQTESSIRPSDLPLFLYVVAHKCKVYSVSNGQTQLDRGGNVIRGAGFVDYDCGLDWGVIVYDKGGK